MNEDKTSINQKTDVRWKERRDEKRFYKGGKGASNGNQLRLVGRRIT